MFESIKRIFFPPTVAAGMDTDTFEKMLTDKGKIIYDLSALETEAYRMPNVSWSGYFAVATAPDNAMLFVWRQSGMSSNNYFLFDNLATYKVVISKPK